MDIIITAKTKAAAALVIEKLKDIEGVKIKTTSAPKKPVKAPRLSPVMAELKASLKEVKAHQEGKIKLKPARQLLVKK